ncbi:MULTISPECIES: glycoside hydrolase family 2 TIM barrel-domain containing protein [unclassified Saccharicrinis]|uniref:glycoside hydrolase family 2 TIM barrel-domain containing protein n=1 Tax=unclassified Saccharicrinis TaxID=2646859 RepID=UPI003D3256C9
MKKNNDPNRIRLLCFFSLPVFLLLIGCSQSNFVEDTSFNENWLFFKGEAEHAEKSDFDDSEWRNLQLPHDWAIEGPFDSKYNARTGGLPVHGTGWYRKHFKINKEQEGKLVSVEFDGAMNNAQVWVNGAFAGHRPYGYIGFEIDITPFVKFGEENIIAVKLKPEDLAARWYTGAGIYRNVRLKINNRLHFEQYGTYITTPKVSSEKASVNIETYIANGNGVEKSAVLTTKIYAPNGALLQTLNSDIVIQSGKTGTVQQNVEVVNPELWDINVPNLYKAVSYIKVDAKTIDRYETTFGIREISFSTENGFMLNGKTVKLKGVCMHHDLGPLGAAINYRAKERQMEIMKSMGVNALRTSHNPPSPELLEICDKLGIVVQVEAFDEWEIGKVPNGYNKYFKKWHEKDLRDMIKRDRNHPCVFMWSIGNEILEQGRQDGWKIAKRLTDICHNEDPTRPTTAGFNYYPAPFKNKLADYIDIIGLNYWPLNYQEVMDMNPNYIVYGSETSSQTSSRGVYHLPIDAMPQKETNQVSSYDAIVGPPWAYPPDVEFEQQEKVTQSLGEFMWTGFDYLGEPTPYGGRDNSTHGYWNDNWPSHSSYFAPVDLCGFPKDRYYLYQSQWTTEPMVHVLPHWNWEGMEGDTIPVIAYTNCDEVELLVNGKSMGKKIKGVDMTPIPAEFHFFEKGTYMSKYRLSWKVPYHPGSIKVVAYKEGMEAAMKEIKTSNDPYQIRMVADRSEIFADGKDLSFITVSVEDRDGNPCLLADNHIQFSIDGAGSIAAVGNGNPASLEPLQADKIKLFNGFCLVIVKSGKKNGKINIKASSAGLQDKVITLTSAK